MSQSQVYLFLYEEFDIWKWITGKISLLLEILEGKKYFSITGQRRRFHAGVNLYGKEYCYTKDGISASIHVMKKIKLLNFQ